MVHSSLSETETGVLTLDTQRITTGHLSPQPYLNVATLQSQTKASLLILDEVQCHLWVPLLLQVGDDGLSHKLGVSHHVQYLQHRVLLP